MSNQTHDYLDDFAPSDTDSVVNIRVLGPIEGTVEGKPGLARFTGGTSKNTNGHSVILRLDHGERRLLLTGDLNTASMKLLMDTYDTEFGPEFRCDVAKGCHHGSHDVSFDFLDGLRPVATVISSGDAETHDHPRPTIVAASAITGRRLVQSDSLVCPLVYMTEVARSAAYAKVSKMKEFQDPQPEVDTKPPKAKIVHNEKDEMARFRLYLGSSQDGPADWPRIDRCLVVNGIRYGLVNVRTDGERLFFAQMEETGGDWAVHTRSKAQIEAAR